MDINGPKDRDHDPAPESSCGGTVRRRPILAPLCDLIGDLSRARVGPVPSGGEGGPPTHWCDDKNIYMNFDLEDAADIDVDINICYGKAYIRVAR